MVVCGRSKVKIVNADIQIFAPDTGRRKRLQHTIFPLKYLSVFQTVRVFMWCGLIYICKITENEPISATGLTAERPSTTDGSRPGEVRDKMNHQYSIVVCLVLILAPTSAKGQDEHVLKFRRRRNLRFELIQRMSPVIYMPCLTLV